MATEVLKTDDQQTSLEALSREAEELKTKLDEERARLNDVDCKSDHYKICVSAIALYNTHPRIIVERMIMTEKSTSYYIDILVNRT